VATLVMMALPGARRWGWFKKIFEQNKTDQKGQRHPQRWTTGHEAPGWLLGLYTDSKPRIRPFSWLSCYLLTMLRTGRRSLTVRDWSVRQ